MMDESPPSGSTSDGIRGRNKKNNNLLAISTSNNGVPNGHLDKAANDAELGCLPDNDEAHALLINGGGGGGGDPSKSQKPSTGGAGAGLRSKLSSMYRWWMSLRQQFGDALILQIFFVYFTQGIRSTLCSLGTSYYLKETLSLLPAQAEALRATAAMPWIIKPVYGMLSDTIPIWGTRRKSYLLIFSALSACAYFALAVPNLVVDYQGALIALVVASLGIAFCDVVIDGKVVEASRDEKSDMAGSLQSLSWLSLSIGSVLGSAISGYTLNTIGPQGVFFLSAMGPLCVVFLSTSIEEEIYQSEVGFVETLSHQATALAKVLVDPICWRPVLWIFLSNALPPSLNEAMFNFKTSQLQFSKNFLGFISTIGSLTLLGTTAAYNAYFKDMPFRALFWRIQLASALISLAEFILVSRINTWIGIGDHFFIFGDEILSDVVARLKHMPCLVLCAKICPPGIEGTMFALLMSIYNFSWSMSSYGGSYICAYLKISKTDFTGLTLAVVIRSLGKLVPIALLFLVPGTTSIRVPGGDGINSGNSTSGSSRGKKKNSLHRLDSEEENDLLRSTKGKDRAMDNV